MDSAHKTPAANQWPVFLSSTFCELELYRKAIEDRSKQSRGLIDRIRLERLDSEEYSRVSQDAADLSIRKVKECDLVILILARQLGSRSAGGQSFTQLEFDTARVCGIPVLAFVLAEDAKDLQVAAVEPGGSGSRQWWEDHQQREFRSSLGGRVTWVGPPDVVLTSPDQLAKEVEKHIQQWLAHHARPHQYIARDNGQSRFFINHQEPYRNLKENVLGGQTSVVFGPSGLGKTTLIDALECDPDIRREFVLPAERRTPYLQLGLDGQDPRSSMEGFRREAEQALTNISSSGQRLLFVLQVPSLGPRRDSTSSSSSGESIADLALQLVAAIPLHPDVVIVFEVVEAYVAAAIEQKLELQNQRIEVKPLTSGAAADLLLAAEGLHLDCSECEGRATAVAEAAGCWPPLIWMCARAFASERSRAAQHNYLRRVEEAFERLPLIEDQMYETFRLQLKTLDDESQKMLDAFAIFLPKPFATSEGVLAGLIGLSRTRATAVLKHLRDRGYVEAVDLPERASVDSEPEPHYAIHPFFWTFLERRLAEAAKQGRPEWGRAQLLHRAALEVLDREVNETVDNDLLYKGWGELENPVRQSLIANWIYQLAFLDSRRIAAEAFTRLYLKAHWWWGYYIPFQFCDFLIHLGNKAKSWSQDYEGDDLLDFVVQRIQEVHRSYPKAGRFEHPLPPQTAKRAWRTVEVNLRHVAELLDVPVETDVGSARRWEPELPTEASGTARERLLDLAKLLHIFLAHCKRGLYTGTPLNDTLLQSIEDHYTCALSLARRQEDSWNQPWILYELGETEWTAAEQRRASKKDYKIPAAKCDRRARMSAILGRSVARRQGEDPDELDFEILALCERLLGETWWSTNQETAMDHLVRAVHYAHCFEVWPDHQPDDYTLHFERHQRAFVVRKLRSEIADNNQSPQRVGLTLQSLIESTATFLGKDPAATWGAWQAAWLRWKDDDGAEEYLSNVLFEPPPGVDDSAHRAKTFPGYRLPPAHGVVGNNEWVRAVKRNQVEAFRREAIAEIREIEERDIDESLVRLP